MAATADDVVRFPSPEVGLAGYLQMIGRLLRSLLALPTMRGLDIDDPQAVELRRQVIRAKPGLRGIYAEWYREILSFVPPGEGLLLELGSGPGFLKDLAPAAITSEVQRCRGVDLVTDAQRLPFPRSSLRAIAMTNVLHHLPDIRLFFDEATRCVRPGGVIVMLEPWVTAWSRVAYSLHHEPFLPEAPDWRVPHGGGPVSAANDALAWIVFSRDRDRFRDEFPEWQIRQIRPTMPFRYILSGGVSMRSLAPAWSYRLWRSLELHLDRWMDHLGMFALICIERRPR